MRASIFQKHGLMRFARMYPVMHWGYCCLRLALVCHVCGNASAFTFGAEAAPSPAKIPQTSEEMLADCERMLFARQALQQDQELANFNLGVTIHGNVATVWGGIATQSLSKRAEEKVRKVAGVAQVVNELRVEPPEEAKKTLFVQPAPLQLSPEYSAVAKGPPTPGALTGASGENRLDMKPGVFVKPQEAKQGAAVPMMPPLVVSFRPNFTTDRQASTRPVIGKTSGDLANVLQKMRMKEERFRQIRPEITGGVVQLSGVVPRLEDMMEFAQAVSRVPGVERVILGNYHTPKKGSLQLP